MAETLMTVPNTEENRAKISGSILETGFIVSNLKVTVPPNRTKFYNDFSPEVACAVQSLLGGRVIKNEVVLMDGALDHFVHELGTGPYDPYKQLIDAQEFDQHMLTGEVWDFSKDEVLDVDIATRLTKLLRYRVIPIPAGGRLRV